VDDLHPIGCVVRVMRVIDARQESKQAIVVGVARTRLGRALAESPALLMSLDPMPDTEGNAAARDEIWKRVVDLAHRDQRQTLECQRQELQVDGAHLACDGPRLRGGGRPRQGRVSRRAVA